MVPGRSPPGVLIVIVPDITRVLILSNAARPPIAAMLFSITSSAVCDHAVCAEARISRISAERIASFMSVSQPYLTAARRRRFGIRIRACAHTRDPAHHRRCKRIAPDRADGDG